MKKYSTIFCDVDGSLFEYRKFESYETTDCVLLPGVKEKFDEWKAAGHMIILTTARPEYLRDHTIKELNIHKLKYDRLIMEIERGPRYLINDTDPNKPGRRAIGINLNRDEGLINQPWDELNL